MKKHYLLASDFDQTLSFNDSGIVLSEMLGITSFREKVAALSNLNLVQQGAELAYLLANDPEYARVTRNDLLQVGRRVRLKRNVELLTRMLAQGIDGNRFDFYVISAAPQEVVLSALEGIVPADHVVGTRFEFQPDGGKIGTLLRVALPPSAEVGGGLRVGRVGGIRVASGAYIGRDCDLAEGVTIASSGGAPWIGDRVLIGPGAKLVGPIRVGNDAAIGPNAVVEADVPDGATVAGVPAHVVPGGGSRGQLVPGRKRPPLLDAMRGLVRGFLTRPTQLLLRG